MGWIRLPAASNEKQGLPLHVSKQTKVVSAACSRVRFSHLNGPLHVWLLITKPHHPHNRHGDAKPVKEAEEVNDGVDVVG